MKPHKPRYGKRDYEFVADLLREAHELFDTNPAVCTAIVMLCERFANKFRMDNPSFDVERFHTAALGKKEKR